MNKNWIMVDSCSMGNSLFGEYYTLYWCGGNAYAVLKERTNVNWNGNTEELYYGHEEMLNFFGQCEADCQEYTDMNHTVAGGF